MKTTERDLKLLSQLNDFGVMTTRQITLEVFDSIDKKTVLRRLRVLEDVLLIKRIPGLANSENAWALTAVGAKHVSDRPPRWNFSRFNLEHDVRLTGLRLTLQRLGIVHSWTPEHEIRHKVLARDGLECGRRMAIADGILHGKVKGLSRAIAVELELNYKNKDRYRRLFDDYKYKTNIHGLWYITPSKSLAETIQKNYWQTPSYGDPPKFYWSIISEIESKPESALIHSGEKSKKIIEFFDKNLLDVTANTPAHGVSGLQVQEGLPRLSTSDENDEEKLAPAS